MFKNVTQLINNGKATINQKETVYDSTKKTVIKHCKQRINSNVHPWFAMN